MGQGSSRSDKLVQDLPDDEHYFGFENFGNTCYCNSVLQALYFCHPFRERVLRYGAAIAAGRQPRQETLLTSLADLFTQVRLCNYSIYTQ
jgi:ubiquitin carboxyl-terminal hydrolase 12/46